MDGAGQLKLLPNLWFGFGVKSDSIMGGRVEEDLVWGQRMNSALASVEVSRRKDYPDRDPG